MTGIWEIIGRSLHTALLTLNPEREISVEPV